MTHFSWSILDRAPHSERELLLLYAAIIGHGTDLTPAQIVRMIPELNAEAIRQAMVMLEDEKLLRKANQTVLEILNRLPLAKVWGKGNWASSDMMSLEASRHLWTARVDPKRRVYAMGTYAHVHDRWGIMYDQPIVLNKRQAGAAIEGVMRQDLFPVDRLAVDTHGYTDFAMAISKLLGFDLCPRLANLSERKLFVPRQLHIPDNLKPVVEPLNLKPIGKGWDGLVRIASSISEGWCSAILALDRYGSDAKGDPVHKAGTALGKLNRTLYLCDFFTLEVFRKTILDILNQGESVHSLQRAIYAGPMSPKRGRKPDEMSAISGSLSLLTNIVVAWNTYHMQKVIDRWQHSIPEWTDPEILKRIAPIRFQHINMRGMYRFPFTRFTEALFAFEYTSQKHARS